MLTVSATEQNDSLASWSNTGNNIDLAAPGVYILTSVMGGSYGNWSGTSFSAPIVAGAAALVLSANPNLTPTQVTSVLRSSADDVGPVGFDTSYGYGRLNANRAVTLALGTSAPVADTTAPSIKITSPLAGTYVSQNVSVTVSTSDNVGVTSVQLFVDGAFYGSSSTAPFTIKWNTRKVARGSHVLTTKAFDAAGNVGLSSPVTVYK